MLHYFSKFLKILITQLWGPLRIQTSFLCNSWNFPYLISKCCSVELWWSPFSYKTRGNNMPCVREKKCGLFIKELIIQPVFFNQCCNQSDEYSASVMLNKDFHNSFSSHLCTLAQFFNPSSRNFLNTPLYFTQLAAEYNRLVIKYDFYSN